MAKDTIRKWSGSADMVFDQATGALLVDLGESGPCSKVLASGTHVPSGTPNGQAFPAAPAGTKRMVIAPRLADSGDAANGSGCFLRHDNANTKAGAPIKPTDGLVNVNTTDPTQFFLKIITAGDGVYYLYLGD